MPYPDETSNTKDMHIIFATAKGKIRKNNLEDFSSINTSGKIAMKLDSDDKIVGVKICKDDQDIILSTKLGKCIRFEAKKLRIFKGRSSKGSGCVGRRRVGKQPDDERVGEPQERAFALSAGLEAAASQGGI